MSFQCRRIYLFPLIVATFFAAFASSEDKIVLYDNKYDDIDVDSILSNSRHRQVYYNCLMSTGPCVTPDAKFLKQKFPEALVTKCKYCTEKQKTIFEKVVVWYTENDPEAWNKILQKAIQGYQTGARS